ncbi:MAG: hypothetical protein HY721_07040 [Planctomycetes bacterium]|nr:hypothetical protein [Planctomycetota bacterium]
MRGALGAAFLLLALSWAGCSGRVRQHPWLTRGDAWAVDLDVAAWPLVEPDRFAWVARERREEAARLLETDEATELSAGEAARFAPDLAAPADLSLRPFLLRGVAYGGLPVYALLRTDEATRQALVYQATYNGENLLGVWALSDLQPCPVVACLPWPPSRVLATAELGGDQILRGIGAWALMRGGGRGGARS